MASEKQVAANRANAKLSTGPTSPTGKERSSRNALKWGVFAKQLLLPDDNREAFAKLRAELYHEWNPVGPTECLHVERLVALYWRQQRYYRAEAGVIEMFRQCPEGTGGIATAITRDTDSFSRVLRLDAATEKSIASTVHLLLKLQSSREDRSGLQPERAKTTDAT